MDKHYPIPPKTMPQQLMELSERVIVTLGMNIKSLKAGINNSLAGKEQFFTDAGTDGVKFIIQGAVATGFYNAHYLIANLDPAAAVNIEADTPDAQSPAEAALAKFLAAARELNALAGVPMPAADMRVIDNHQDGSQDISRAVNKPQPDGSVLLEKEFIETIPGPPAGS